MAYRDKQDIICAGVVTYNPDLTRLIENIDAIHGQVSKVIIVDNASENIQDIREILTKYNNCELLCNDINYGIAQALNRAVNRADECGADWILTLDQDSVCYPNLIPQYIHYINLDKAGMLTCDIVDRNYSFHDKKSLPEYEVVNKCITSGCLMNIEACKKSGMFDEKLFIDSVDYDMCYSMQEQGYLIYNIHFKGLLHEVGKSVGHNIGGFEFAVTNHSPLRKYYISRNSTYLIKKHHLNPIKEYFVIYRRILTVLIFEENKWEKITSIIRGIHDGRRM